jgi:hypothetical protein
MQEDDFGGGIGEGWEDDNAKSICMIVPHELEWVEDKEQMARREQQQQQREEEEEEGDEEEERRRRRVARSNQDPRKFCW